MSYVLSESLEVDFVLETVKKLFENHRASIDATAMIHSDQGCHYTSTSFRELLNCLGVLYNVWPTAMTKPDGPKNIAVFDTTNVRIIKRERIEIENKCKKWVLTNRTEI